MYSEDSVEDLQCKGLLSGRYGYNPSTTQLNNCQFFPFFEMCH